MEDKQKIFGEIMAVDMLNGYTYIGRGHCGDNPLMLKNVLMIKTSELVSEQKIRKGRFWNKRHIFIDAPRKDYKKTAKEQYAIMENMMESYNKTGLVPDEGLEKEVRIDGPVGPIHFLDIF